MPATANRSQDDQRRSAPISLPAREGYSSGRSLPALLDGPAPPRISFLCSRVRFWYQRIRRMYSFANGSSTGAPTLKIAALKPTESSPAALAVRWMCAAICGQSSGYPFASRTMLKIGPLSSFPMEKESSRRSTISAVSDRLFSAATVSSASFRWAGMRKFTCGSFLAMRGHLKHRAIDCNKDRCFKAPCLKLTLRRN